MPSIHPSQFSTPEAFRAEWLRLRRQHITSTECAALFGMSPYFSMYELWHRKAGLLPDDFEGNERTEWGTALQDAIAAKISDDAGLEATRMDDYIFDPVARIGSSFDFECTDRVLLEIKNVDSLVFRNTWLENAAVPGGYEAPPHIELQVQHQVMVSGYSRAYIGACVGGNSSVLLPREYDPVVGQAIREAVAKFWASIEANEPPPPTMPEDAAMVIALYKTATGETITADDETRALIQQYHEAKQREKAAETDAEVIKAQVLQRIGTASKVLAAPFTLSVPQVEPTQGTLITPDMVGTFYGARKGFRMFRVTEKKA